MCLVFLCAWNLRDWNHVGRSNYSTLPIGTAAPRQELQQRGLERQMQRCEASY
jgi:hypothetical protein